MRSHSLLAVIAVMLFICLPTMWAETPPPVPTAVPAATAADWKASAPAAAAAADHQAQTTAATAPTPDNPWLNWVLGAGALVLAIARFAAASNPLSSVLVSVLDTGWKLLAPTHVQAAEAVQAQLAGGLQTVVHVIDQFPANSTIGELKASLQGRLAEHPLAAAAVNGWITEAEKNGVGAWPSSILSVSAESAPIKPFTAPIAA